MLVSPDSPCPECGHPRRNHDFGNLVPGTERCSDCDCSIPIAHARFDWNPNDDPQPFDWSQALELIVLMTEMETGCTEFVLGAQPPFALAPDELEDLVTVDRTVRDLWMRYRPAAPMRHRLATIGDENAAVDQCEAEKEQLREVLRNLTADDAWRTQFSIVDHAAVERVRSIVVSRNSGAR